VSCFKNNIKVYIKFTLKELQHVSVLQLNHQWGAYLFMLNKVTVVKVVHWNISACG